jgi:hypothetical protein
MVIGVPAETVFGDTLTVRVGGVPSAVTTGASRPGPVIERLLIPAIV